jgi:hypothetical protein
VKPNWELMGVILTLLVFWGWIMFVMGWGQ